MNFCVAILVLKMEENKQHFWQCIIYYFKKGKNATETQRKDVSRVWRRGASDRMCRKFRAGESSLDDAPRSGRPVEVDSYQIETLIESNLCYTMQETANILKICKPIKLSVKIKKCLILWKKIIRSFWSTQYFPLIRFFPFLTLSKFYTNRTFYSCSSNVVPDIF